MCVVIKNPNDIVDELISDFVDISGTELVSVILHGSAVSHEYRPGKSVINTIFVFNDLPAEKVDYYADVYRKWYRKGVEVTLLLQRKCLKILLETSPVEFLQIQNSYRILYGEDVLSGVKVEKNPLSIQCRREINAASLHLATGYLHTLKNVKQIEVLLISSVKKLLPVLKALLVVNDRKVPNTDSEAVAMVEDLYGLGVSAFSDILYNRNKFRNNYHELVVRLSNTLDAMICRNADAQKIETGSVCRS